ncbi:MAG: hypothetical protein FD180_1447 [Planctomycetota bacterium]|nr:MAG: hypothetical protein FD180_1447 [Planctomycetota bacterium]
MKLPRDLSGSDLAKRLAKFGYSVTRQSGSHIRLTTMIGGEHHVTIPAHSTLKTGTLSGIVGDVAMHLGRDKSVVSKELFE